MKQITLKEVEIICDNLLKNIEKPEVIIAIESGGWYIGNYLSQKMNVPLFSITIRRKINLSYFHNSSNGFMKILGKIFQYILFLLKKPVLQEELSNQQKVFIAGKNILIVDDAIQSGFTMNIAIKYLNTLYPKKIEILIINNVFGFYKCKFFNRGITRFPWSKTSSEYKQYLKIRSS